MQIRSGRSGSPFSSLALPSQPGFLQVVRCAFIYKQNRLNGIVSGIQEATHIHVVREEPENIIDNVLQIYLFARKCHWKGQRQDKPDGSILGVKLQATLNRQNPSTKMKLL